MSDEREQEEKGEIETKSSCSSFVFKRGTVGKCLNQLVEDLKCLMSPHTAINLKSKRSNKMKEYVKAGKDLGITHFVIISKRTVCANLNFVKLPLGPTLHFQITSFSNAKDVIKIVHGAKFCQSYFKDPPLLVLSGFNMELNHHQLISSFFQGMFPCLNIQKIKLAKIRRVVVISYDTESDLFHLRHFGIHVSAHGVSSGIKDFLKNRLPDVKNFKDISDYIAGGDQDGDESISEDIMRSAVVSPRLKVLGTSSNNKTSQKKASVRLFEIGPRISMKLVKIQSGLMCGDVLFHSFVDKTEREANELRSRHTEKRRLKEERKKIQEQNVVKKLKSKNKLKFESQRSKKIKSGN